MSQRRQRHDDDASGPEDDGGGGGQADAVNACVRFIVCREGSKVPVKRTEIVKHLTNVSALPSARVGEILAAANMRLKKVYGYKLVQVEARGGTQYIVVSCEDGAGVECPVVPASHRALLTAALMHVFMSGGCVKEEDMWKFLAKARLLEENDHTGRKILTNTFTKQMYLAYLKEGEGDFSRYVFRWGQRASEETNKMFMLQKIAEALGKTPEHWTEQHRLATEEQG